MFPVRRGAPALSDCSGHLPPRSVNRSHVMRPHGRHSISFPVCASMTIGAWFGKPRHLKIQTGLREGARSQQGSGGCKRPLRPPAAFELAVHHLDVASPRTASRGDLRLVARHLRPCGSGHEEIDRHCKRTGFPPHLVLRLKQVRTEVRLASWRSPHCCRLRHPRQA